VDFKLTEKQLMLQSMVKDFTAKEIEPRAAEIDGSGKVPEDLIKKYADLGLYGMAVPAAYDGTDVGNFSKIIALEQLAYAGCPAWWPVAFNNSLPYVICKFGNEEQRRKYVKGCLDGSRLYSIQFTEPETGSDPSALTTTARPDGDYYVINGQKRFSTFGAKDGPAIVWTRDDEGGCTCFLVEKNGPGYTAPKIWELMAGEGEPADVYYEDFSVHKDNILHGKGKGFEVLLYWISIEKVEGCAVAVGMAQAALDEAVTYARNRISRGKPISAMQGIRWELADMYSRLQACRWYTYRTAALLDEDPGAFQVEAAACKNFVQPVVAQIILESLRLHGGYGITRDFKVERLYRSQPGNIVISVSLEINKSIVGANLVK